ncbi:MAG: CHAT domain-containing protein [Saprospiraceae bacterium]|nr:CHAT domain-containing protein [Saprospiraceae bacterium]
MEVLFFAFANDPKNPLTFLKEEADELFRLLSPGQLKGHYILIFEPFTTREKLVQSIIQYKSQMVLFHYSGHAGQSELATADESSNAEGIAYLLGQCPNLKLAFLNGCSTQGQVNLLWEKGVPSILGTSAPVEDSSATQFSVRFYQALGNQEQLKVAFELAKGDILTKSLNIDIQLNRSVHSLVSVKEKAEWGLFVKEGREDILQWKIPTVVVTQMAEDFVANKVLVDTLILALAPYSRDVRNIKRDEEDGEKIDFADKRLAILNSLPSPVAEQLRKLMVPLGDSDAGFDKVGLARVAQIVRTYTTIIELFTFINLAQLWDSLEAQPAGTLPATSLDIIRKFFQLNSVDRDTYEMIALMRAIREAMNANKYTYFIEELASLKAVDEPESPFFDACNYMEALKRRVDSKTIEEHEVQEACQQGEQKLAEIFKDLGFLARYTLAAVRMIDVVKFRHDKAPKFRHALVNLVKVMGGLELQEELLDKYMDSRSVLLLKKTDELTTYINLSPFVIDENAFEERTSDVSKVYFFYNYDRSLDKYSFRHVNKPADIPLVVSGDNKYGMVKVQFDAFANLIFHQNMKAL